MLKEPEEQKTKYALNQKSYPKKTSALKLIYFFRFWISKMQLDWKDNT